MESLELPSDMLWTVEKGPFSWTFRTIYSGPMSHSQDYLWEVSEIADLLLAQDIEKMVDALSNLTGRLFLIGLGGSYANCIHMAADLRKLCNIDADAFANMSELTARANDEGMDTIFTGWLAHMKPEDALFVLSVGGGTELVSRGIYLAVERAKSIGSKVYGIVGPAGGYTYQHGDLVIRVPVKERVTPHTEAFQGVIWHAMVSHPKLQKNATKW